jgi:hypothetical protein
MVNNAGENSSLYIYINFSNINLQKYCKQQDLETAVIQIKINKDKIIIFCIYRAPPGNFDCFLNKIDFIHNSLYRHNLEFVLCGDININYMETSSKKTQLDDMLKYL